MTARILDIRFEDFQSWGWDRIQPFFESLEAAPLTAETAVDWLTAWERLNKLLGESYQRLYVGTTVNTADKDTEERFFAFLDTISEPASVANQRLKQRLLDSGIEPKGYAVILRGIRSEADLFREANVPLLTEEEKLTNEYDKIIGAQEVMWEGEARTIPQMNPLLMETDRARRERAWTLRAERQLADRAALNDLWTRMLSLRRQIAANAGEPDFRAYTWKRSKRFDYTPEDCLRFHEAIESVVVPAAQALYEKRRHSLGIDRLRPWDLDVDPLNRQPLKPFTAAESLVAGAETIFRQVDPALGAHFADMRANGLLDLDSRKNKAPGGYCTEYPIAQKPFIFMNAVGVHDDVQTLLHEGGHAFHVYEANSLQEYRRTEPPLEFCEVASMSMELLAAPYLAASQGGYYSESAAARARIEHLEGALLFWPYMAVVDAFQHWVYTHADAAMDPANCDAEWGRQWDRFMKGIDFDGLDEVRVTGWHRKLHIFQIPFYYVEYGIAQIGAVQVWLNSLQDLAKATADYRRALALGGTEPLPALFAAAGARFAMDRSLLQTEIDAMMRTIEALESASG
ncbi:MAG: M3 family oligoendopeptidase [Anaerolineae bacterium]|nr:M3 family oligoendopeptidase [Anaerolineae bacterium]NUQ05311.1 M3 family oligoendopeptidase [Anaerolineae bacterium]